MRMMMMMMVLLKIMMIMINNNVSSIAMKLIIDIPVRHKLTSWFLYIWTQMLWLQLIMAMMIVVTYWPVFNCCSQFSVPKWQKLAQPMRSCFAFSFFGERSSGWLIWQWKSGGIFEEKKHPLCIKNVKVVAEDPGAVAAVEDDEDDCYHCDCIF